MVHKKCQKHPDSYLIYYFKWFLDFKSTKNSEKPFFFLSFFFISNFKLSFEDYILEIFFKNNSNKYFFEICYVYYLKQIFYWLLNLRNFKYSSKWWTQIYFIFFFQLTTFKLNSFLLQCKWFLWVAYKLVNNWKFVHNLNQIICYL